MYNTDFLLYHNNVLLVALIWYGKVSSPLYILLPTEHALYRRHNIVRLRRGGILADFGIRHRRVHAANSNHRGVEIVESRTFGDRGGDFGADAVLRPAAFHSDAVVCLHDGGVDGVHVERSDGAEVDDLGGDSLLGQLLGSGEGEAHSYGVRHKGDVISSPHDLNKGMV